MKVLNSNELREKISSGETFMVDLYADWCGPCRVLGPIVERVATKLEEEGSEMKVYKFNIESDKELASELGVRSIPTIQIFSEGKNIATKIGLLQENQLIEWSKSVL